MTRFGDVGIFASEPGERFLRIIIKLVEHCIGDIHTSLGTRDPTLYASCLKRVSNWSDKLVREQLEEVDAPDLVDRIVNSYETYSALVFPETKITTPPSVEYITRKFLTIVCQTAPIHNGSFFAPTQGIVRRLVCMDSMRDALYEIASERAQDATKDCSYIEYTRDPNDYEILPSDSVSNV